MSRAQIELSVNTIVIIIVSIAIVTTGIIMLYKFSGALTNTVRDLNKQTESILKSFMLKNNYNVAVYPQYVTIAPGGNTLAGLGVTNSLDATATFQISSNPKVTLHRIYNNPVTSSPMGGYWVTDIMIEPKSYIRVKTNSFPIINPKDQNTKAILINVPKDAERGEYEISLNVLYKTPTMPASLPYGTVKIYVSTG